MSKYDEIEVVEKGIDEVEVVEKFNPFHDARGRFANKNGFASYSANPNTRAGAMAIARSAAAGHGNTRNVHSQSYGENIRQNANWLGRGKQASPGQQGNATLRQRVEPVAGLGGASATGASWQHQNQAQGRTTQPGKQPAQQQQTQQQAQPQKPAPAKQTQTQQPQQKPAQQQQNAQQNTSDRQPVDGKDISKTFQYDPNKGSAIDQVTELQGFKGKPTLVKDSTEFSAAVKDSGFMAYRTWHKDVDVVTGKMKSAADFADDLKNTDAFKHNGTGGQCYGTGIYIASTSNPMKGTAPSRNATNAAKADSRGYGYNDPNKKTVGMTLTKDAKIGDYNKLYSEFNKLPRSQRAKFGFDEGAYIASKGYDAARAVNAGYGCDYTVVYNRTKLIIFDS